MKNKWFLFIIVCHLRFGQIAAPAKKATPVVIPALGRSFALGQLYDKSRDRVITGLAPWNLQKLGNNSLERDTPNVKAHMTAMESLSERSVSFGVKARVKASFFGGLFTIKGAAGFMFDIAGSSYEASVSFYYHRRTHMRFLSMSALTKPDYPDAYVKNLDATHVVTGIEYGANAVFKLSRKSSSYSGKIGVSGKLEDDCKDSMNDKGGESGISKRKDMNTTKVTYHGDIKIGKPPVTFEDAVQAYKRLPSLVNKSTVIPLRVHLTPVALLKENAGKQMREISNYLLSEVASRMEHYDHLEVSIKDLKDTPAFVNLNTFRGHINGFERAVKIHRGAFQTQLNRLLPQIRGSGKAEDALAKALDQRSDLIGIQQLNNYLEQKEKEGGALTESTRSCPEAILHKSGAFNKVLYDTTIQYVLVFTYYLYKKTDTFIDCITNNCGTKRMLTNARQKCKDLKCAQNVHYQAWTDNPMLRSRIRKEFSKFKHVYDQNRITDTRRSGHRVKCLIRSDANGNVSEGFAIEVFKKGKMFEKHLHLPEVQNLTRSKIKIINKKKGFMLSWNVYISPKSKNWFTGNFLVQYRHPSALHYTTNTTVNKKTSVIIYSVCDVEVRVNLICIFGMCGYETGYFMALDPNDVTCDKEKLKILKEKEKRDKAFKKHAITDAERFAMTRIVTAGGKDANQKASNQIFIYTPIDDSTVLFDKRRLPQPRYGHVTAALKSGQILVAGGKDAKDTVTKQALLINMRNGKMKQMRPMNVGRADAAFTISDDRVYVCGGTLTKSAGINTCETFIDGKWVSMAQQMTKARVGAAMVVLNGYLWVLGGRKGDTFLKDTERFFLRGNNQWEVGGGDMKQTRAYFAAAVFNDTICVCGGLQNDKMPPIKSCECYKDRQWQKMAELNTGRAYLGLLALADGQLYAVGGAYGTKEKNTLKYHNELEVDVYGHKPLQWSSVGEVQNGRSHSQPVMMLLQK